MKINKTLECIKIIKSLPFFFLCVLIAYPILPYAMQSITIGLLFASSLFNYWNEIKKNILKRGVAPFLFITGWFLLVIITLLYSSNFEIGIKRVLRGINLIIIPILFIYILPSYSLKKRNILYNIFIYTHVFLIFFLLFKSFEGIDKLGFLDENNARVKNISSKSYLELVKVFFSMPFAYSRYYINENEITTFFIHKAYLSIGLVWSVFLMIDRLLFQPLKVAKGVLFSFLILIFIIAIVYFTSIPNIIALCILLPLFVFFKIKSFRKRVVYIFVSVISIIALFQVDVIKDRIFEDVRLKKDIAEVKGLLQTLFDNKPYENANIRLDVWKCSFKQIGKDIWFGYGIGDEEEILLGCYKSINCEDCIEQQLNTHNYYSSLLLIGGIVTLMMFLIALGYMFKIGVVAKNYLFLVMILLIGINLLSENMLVRIHGILFYVLFSGILLNQSYSKFDFVEK